MRVCLVSNLYPPDALGGAEIVVGHLARGLQAAGHEVMAVATAPRARAGWDTVDGVRVCRLGPANIYWAGDASRRARVVKPLWHLVDLWNPVMYRRLRALLAAQKPDVVHTHNLGGLSAAAWSATRATGVPLVHTLHDPLADVCARGPHDAERARVRAAVRPVRPPERLARASEPRGRCRRGAGPVRARAAPGARLLPPGAHRRRALGSAAAGPGRRVVTTRRRAREVSLHRRPGAAQGDRGSRARGVPAGAGRPRLAGHRRGRHDGGRLPGRRPPRPADPLLRVRGGRGEGAAPRLGRRPALPVAPCRRLSAS